MAGPAGKAAFDSVACVSAVDCDVAVHKSRAPTSDSALTHHSAPRRSTITVRFETPAHAELAARSLAVDDDLQPDRAVKSFRVVGTDLVADLAAADARLLRVITLSLFDMVAVVVRTLREFA